MQLLIQPCPDQQHAAGDGPADHAQSLQGSQGLFGFAVNHQLDQHHGPQPAHLADDRPLAFFQPSMTSRITSPKWLACARNSG